MKRKAILISASPSFDPLPGASLDVAAWSTFLRSNEGGAWNWDEITELCTPSKTSLLKAINSARDADYAIIAYSGHGEMVEGELPWAETIVQINDTEFATERDLNPGTPRCTIILDCCRTKSKLHGRTLFIESLGMEKSGENRQSYRDEYEDQFSIAESGLIKIYSTEPNAAAADENSFTQHLLLCAKRWATYNQGVLTQKDAVNLALESIKHSNSQQKPEYQGGRRYRHFPLAIRL